MRPTYETRENRKAEQAVVRKVVRTWWPDGDVNAIRLPVKSSLDVGFARGKDLIGFGEVKVRSHDHGQYPTLLLSMEKWNVAVGIAKNIRVPVCLLVQFSDILMWAPMEYNSDITVGMGGREDRADPEDVEPVVFIPMDLFKVVE